MWFSEKKSSPKRWRIEFFWLGLLVFYLFFLGARGAWHQYQMSRRYHNLIKQIEAAQELNAQQKRKISRLQDLRYIEFLARDRLGLVKPGEKVYKLIEPEGGGKR